ncbi:nicotinamide-nucleotide amidohydrolase family protein [Stappia sp. GBMRC 2046]|uniref:Nicotinamide-nucleotide amidohydrolase family protein n=1 Tax=Stappia sediminis TaxID=2692190 RepID=A0A7X3S9I3_9HYPH|nr:CinA family protein [Stappia sediminis]MXN66961.1 nicotinamide-nucleotide amidohydrolase family protein [Stappia sediminis]
MTDLSTLKPLAQALIEECTAKGAMIVTAESCTGGLIAGLLTEIAGSSAVVDRGFVTYSNAAKTEMLGVPEILIEELGAVSGEVAIAMAQGALARSRADIAISVTGIAGPGGGSEEKPVGLVHFAFAQKDGPTRHIERRFGDLGRDGIRLASVRQAIECISNFTN